MRDANFTGLAFAHLYLKACPKIHIPHLSEVFLRKNCDSFIKWCSVILRANFYQKDEAYIVNCNSKDSVGASMA